MASRSGVDLEWPDTLEEMYVSEKEPLFKASDIIQLIGKPAERVFWEGEEEVPFMDETETDREKKSAWLEGYATAVEELEDRIKSEFSEDKRSKKDDCSV